MLFCTAGELVGFGAIPVLGGAIAFSLTGSLSPGLRSLVLYAVAIIGGFGEGAVLAAFQLQVLRERFPRLNARRWILSTALAASVAWLCGYLAPTLDDLIGISPVTQVVIWIPAGVLILLSIGSAQAWALRDTVEKPSQWITANVLGWLCGLPWTFVLPAALPDTAPVAVRAATFVLAGMLMGTTVGVVTGYTLVRLVPVGSSDEGDSSAVNATTRPTNDRC